VVSVDSQDVVGGNYAATNALDGTRATFWHTEWYQRTAPLPHTLVLDLGASIRFDGFRYLPRQDGNPNGTIADYQFSVSPDGTTWGTAVAAGTLAADPSEKNGALHRQNRALCAPGCLVEMNGGSWTSAAELNVFGTAVVSTPTSSLIPQQQFRVVSVDSQDVVGGNYAATNALDGTPATFWHTEWYQRTTPLPHTLVLDLGGPYQVDGFRYLPGKMAPLTAPLPTTNSPSASMAPPGALPWRPAHSLPTPARKRCASRQNRALCAPGCLVRDERLLPHQRR